MNIFECIKKISDGGFDYEIKNIYGTENIEKQKARIINAAEKFEETFPNRKNADISLFSAPGRTEIGGNHTDHQGGCVLAAAVRLDVIGIVCFHSEPYIRIKSKGYCMDITDIKDLNIHCNEKETSAAIIRGIAAGFVNAGYNIGGFDAYTVSDVPSGSGLSSSAAFETFVGTVLNSGYNGNTINADEIAKIGQYAENKYFGKKSGLMDQMTCSVGGLVFMDFKDIKNPKIKTHKFDFNDYGYTIYITDTKGSHSDLSDEYTCITEEMTQIALQLDKTRLRDVNENDFYKNLPNIREKCSDRAVLRAMHFFDENHRAEEQSKALKNKNIDYFLDLANASGTSSAQLLQNLYSVKNTEEQSLPFAIAASKHILKGKFAVRVHGGGFAGTIQAIIPNNMKNIYKKEMERFFGKDCCCEVKIRPFGGIKMF